MQVGSELTKHNCKSTAKCSQVSNVFSKGFNSSIQCGSGTCTLYVLRDETIRKSVQAVDEKQDIFLLWPIKHPSLHFGRI